jgi:acyl-CoA dehydrogenase
MAARDIRALPKLEGTVHVNIALIVKFAASYFFNHASYPEVGRRDEAADDLFLFDQGPARGLGKILFHDYRPVYAAWDLPNVAVFREQTDVFRTLLATAPPSEDQRRDPDFLLAMGEIFTLVVYGQLILENAGMHRVPPELVDLIFDFMVRDFSRFALELLGKPSTTDGQAELCRRMIRRPSFDAERYGKIWSEHVFALRDAYEMTP